ncbi:MAG: phosphonate ABC transporter, permease protein PhnE [Hyphomicrobiaceae bacterium]|nr:phosphonate ABC transporter, permease protein PhnE [Hyphomicrobiaceae bacterium]
MAAATDLAKVNIPSQPLASRYTGWLLMAAIALLLAWGFYPVEMHKVGMLYTDSGNMATFIKGFLAPNFRDWQAYVKEMVETIQIAVWGTFLAVVVAIPFGILSSSNVCPQWVVQPVRRLMDATRAINEIVLALVFVVAVGLGPLAGVLAIFVHTVGVLSKLFSEAVEAIDPRPVEGIRATGASGLQEVIYGVIPQVAPLWSSYSLYRFESNVRSATVLGIVGAGGIGHSLYENIRSFMYAETSAIIIIMIVTVSLIDMISSRLRAWLV